MLQLYGNSICKPLELIFKHSMESGSFRTVQLKEFIIQEVNFRFDKIYFIRLTSYFKHYSKHRKKIPCVCYTSTKRDKKKRPNSNNGTTFHVKRILQTRVSLFCNLHPESPWINRPNFFMKQQC